MAKLCPATEGTLSAGDKAIPAEAKAVCKYDSTNRVGTYHYIIVYQNYVFSRHSSGGFTFVELCM